MTVFYSDMGPLSRYSPVKLHLSLATRTLSENAVEPKINVALLTGWLYYCVGSFNGCLAFHRQLIDRYITMQGC